MLFFLLSRPLPYMQDMHLLLLSVEASVVKAALWEDSIVAVTMLDSTHQPHLHTYIT